MENSLKHLQTQLLQQKILPANVQPEKVQECLFSHGGNVTLLRLLIIIQKAEKEEVVFQFMPLGQGLQDWAPIVEAVKASDVEYVIYEKDQWYEGNPFDHAKQSRDYLKNTFGI